MTNLRRILLRNREIKKSTHRERDPGAMVAVEETEDSPRRGVVDVVLPSLPVAHLFEPLPA